MRAAQCGGRDWNAAYDLAEIAGKRRPALKPYCVDAILKLAHCLGRHGYPRAITR